MRGAIIGGVVLLVVMMFVSTESASAAARQSQRSTTEVHRVRAGETLWSLARRRGTTPERIARLNGISTDATLSIGQRLRVPAMVVSRPASSATRGVRDSRPAPAARESTVVHHVRAGDTLWSLARRHGTTPERLAALNGLSTTATLSLGQPLNVPATVAASAPTATAARVASAPPPAAGQPPEAVTEPANSQGTAPAPPSDAPTAPAAAPVAPRRIATLPSRGAAWSSTVVALSTRLLGVPYRWAGTDPSAFDCSGFIYYVFQRTGVALPRTTYDMFDTGTEVPHDQLQAGDVVFFQTLQPGASHAGIYLGDGRFIHSSSGFRRVTITPMNHRYYAPRYLGARRF